MSRLQSALDRGAVRAADQRDRGVPAVPSVAGTAQIEFRVVTATHAMRYAMPWSDAPLACLGGIPADMLHGATLILDPELIDARREGAVQATRGFHEAKKGR